MAVFLGLHSRLLENIEVGAQHRVFAEALAGELGLRMITTTFGDVASKWIGETTEKVMTAFNDAEVQAPCVLFMDEIDSLLPFAQFITLYDDDEYTRPEGPDPSRT